MSEQKITTGTIVRTLILSLALINQSLSMAGHSPLPIQDDQVETIITTGWTIIASLIAWWKNNSFTKIAIEADLSRKEG